MSGPGPGPLHTSPVFQDYWIPDNTHLAFDQSATKPLKYNSADREHRPMSKVRRFIQCDVFSPTPTKGNALAVVLDGEGLSDSQMQTFAAWTNLAETTFLLPPTDPEADYRVRIFTTAHEMLFAGHPTLGSCASWLHCGGKPKNTDVVRQQCGVGIVEIDQRGNTPAFIAPPTDIQALPQTDIDFMASTLKIAHESIIDTARLDNGPVWQVFELASAQDVLKVDSTLANWSERKMVGLIGPHDSDCLLYTSPSPRD